MRQNRITSRSTDAMKTENIEATNAVASEFAAFRPPTPPTDDIGKYAANAGIDPAVAPSPPPAAKPRRSPCNDHVVPSDSGPTDRALPRVVGWQKTPYEK
jgi:hypothetical protein